MRGLAVPLLATAAFFTFAGEIINFGQAVASLNTEIEPIEQQALANLILTDPSFANEYDTPRLFITIPLLERSAALDHAERPKPQYKEAEQVLAAPIRNFQVPTRIAAAEKSAIELLLEEKGERLAEVKGSVKTTTHYKQQQIVVVPTSIQGKVVYYARQHGVPEVVALAVVKQESGFNPKAHGDNGKAYGLGQIWCTTAQLEGFKGKCKELFNPDTNLHWSMGYLKKAIDGGGVWKYNQGIGAKRPVKAALRYQANVKRLMKQFTKTKKDAS